MRYVQDIEDANGDLIELSIYCSADCFREGTGLAPFGHYIPEPRDD